MYVPPTSRPYINEKVKNKLCYVPQANNYQIKHDHNSTYKILTIFVASQSEILLLRLCNNKNYNKKQ